MNPKVYFTNVVKSSEIGLKVGLSYKFTDSDWVDTRNNYGERYDNLEEYASGNTLDRSAFPEKAAVINKEWFDQIGDIFAIAGFIAVKRDLAKILFNSNLGNGNLIKFPILDADLRTEIAHDYYFVNLGCKKNTFVSTVSKNVDFVVHNKDTKEEIWSVRNWASDGDIALLAKSIDEFDLWVEEKIPETLFMSDRLACRIKRSGIKDVFIFRECRLI